MTQSKIQQAIASIEDAVQHLDALLVSKDFEADVEGCRYSLRERLAELNALLALDPVVCCRCGKIPATPRQHEGEVWCQECLDVLAFYEEGIANADLAKLLQAWLSNTMKEENKIRGIGVEGVASEIGALGRHTSTFRVARQDLVDSLMRRYNAPQADAEAAIRKAVAAGVVYETDGMVILRLDGTEE